MATFILASFIFGSAAWIIFRQLKGDSSCSSCPVDCPTKPIDK